jgi:hypothetical protein
VQLWLVDQLADVRSESDMFPPGSPLPVSLRAWTRSMLIGWLLLVSRSGRLTLMKQ